MPNATTLLSQHPVWTALAAAIGIAASIAKAFEWFDGALNDDSRFKLSLWLVSVPGDEQIDAWANIFPNLIDRVFGIKPLSWRFFQRSCVASLIAVIACLTLIAIAVGPRKFTEWGRIGLFELFVAMLIPSVGYSFIPDYFSILISRTIVRMMSKRPKPFRVAGLLMLDTALTFILAYAAISLVTTIWYRMLPWVKADSFWNNPIHQTYIIFYATYYNLTHDEYTTMIYLLASMFTSVWVWLYILASVTVRILHKVRFIWVKLVPILDIEKKPMQAIGRVAGAIAGCSYLALLCVVWLFKHL